LASQRLLTSRMISVAESRYHPRAREPVAQLQHCLVRKDEDTYKSKGRCPEHQLKSIVCRQRQHPFGSRESPSYIQYLFGKATPEEAQNALPS
jgi:hypothetical protein